MGKRKVKLKTKLIAGFIALALCIVLIMLFAVNILFKGTFKQYVHSKHLLMGESIADNLPQYYVDGNWQNAGINSLCRQFSQQGLRIEVFDAAGRLLNSQGNNHHGKGHNNTPADLDSKTVEEFPVYKDGSYIGYAALIYDDPYYYNEQDRDFLTMLNRICIGVAVASSITAIILGRWFAGQISRPISKVTVSVGEFTKGNFSNHIQMNTNTEEIAVLIDTFNQLADNLENQKLLRKRLTSDLSHELRTPIALIQGHIEALIDGLWEPTTQRLESIKNEVIRFNLLVGELEKLNQIDSDNFELKKSYFDMKFLIEQLYRHFENDFKNKNLSFEINSDSLEIFADKDKISQILVNLISNAFKYTEPEGRVIIQYEKKANFFTLSVSDTGIGIKKEDLPYVFERLYRTDKSRNSSTGGRGIGLAVVKSIAEAHGGTVQIISDIGKGTIVTVKIPQ